ncbi:PAS domain S-box protein [Marivirga sp. S37H4]|uniref:PAS domain S-box protein n=1 Tax=Marivirga aurantiaca TaxID=2802615 RepID=A0A934WWT6_9BACT|nr:PAS domain S-box protein [Marivirga aurantiaca]MBK6264316.1 PAS domain S-box protein [Marivirga aurantiaca]
MGKFTRNLYDWKIRRLTYIMGAGMILLAIAVFYIISNLGYTEESLLRSEKLGNINKIALPLHPDMLSQNEAKAENIVREIEKLLYTFEQGGKYLKGKETIKVSAPDKELKASLDDLRAKWDPYKNLIYSWKDGQKSLSELSDELTSKYAAFMKEANAIEMDVHNLAKAEEKEENVALIILLAYIVLLIFLIYWIVRYLILSPIYKISLTSRELAKGNLSEQIKFDSKNELGYIARNINSLADILKHATDFTTKIGEGKLDADYQGVDKNDSNSLANSLLKMRDQMQKSAIADRERNWVTEGLAKFADILRNNNDNIEELSYQIISNLVKYMEANQGALFVLTEPDLNDDEEPKIVLEAAYAYERRKRLNKEISIGEGLIGQAVQEGDKIYLTEVPENFVEIKSGLGETLPRCILIVPLKINEQIKGVVEIASIKPIPQYRVEFVEKLGENIASTIANAKTNERTKVLLEESQSMTEQMRAQEEEMRQNMEEMEATQEEMARAQAEMGFKESTLNALINNTTDSIILIDKDYTILVMNQVIKDRYKGTQYESMSEGSNALDMLGDVKEEWKGYYDRAFNGEKLSFTIKSSVKGENTYRHYDIHPIKETNGEITGATIFSRDITEQKNMELQKEEVAQKMKERGYVLDGMINNTEDTYFAIDREYNILVVNEVLQKRYKQSGIDLKAGMNILNLLPKDQMEKWKSRYDQALKGEKVKVEEVREMEAGNLIIETRCEPILGDKNEVIGISTVSKDITALKKAEKENEELKKKLGGK